MGLSPSRSVRLAELEEFARRRGKSTADAFDEALAEYLEWERYLEWEGQDHQEAAGGSAAGSRGREGGSRDSC